MLRLARWLLFAAVQPFGLIVKCWDGSVPPGLDITLCPAQPAQDISGAYHDQAGVGGVVGAHPLAAPTLEQAAAKPSSKPQEPMKQFNFVNKVPPGMGWLLFAAVAVAVASKH